MMIIIIIIINSNDDNNNNNNIDFILCNIEKKLALDWALTSSLSNILIKLHIKDKYKSDAGKEI